MPCRYRKPQRRESLFKKNNKIHSRQTWEINMISRKAGMRGFLIVAALTTQCALATAQSKNSISPDTASLSVGEVKPFTLTCATGVPSTNPGQVLSNPNLAMIVSGGQTGPNASQVQIRGNMAGAETLFLWCNQPR